MTIALTPDTALAAQLPGFCIEVDSRPSEPTCLSPEKLKSLGNCDGYFATPCDQYLNNFHYVDGYYKGFIWRLKQIDAGIPAPVRPVAAGQDRGDATAESDATVESDVTPEPLTHY